MLDTTHVFDRLRIDHRSAVIACQEVGNMIRDSATPLTTSSKLFNDFLSLDVRFDDEVYARVCCKSMIQQIVEKNNIVDDSQVILDYANAYAKSFCEDPKWSYLWSKPENVTTATSDVQVQVVKELDTKVAVKADGSIKKGGKQILAQELYTKHVVDATTPLTNVEFIALIMKELDMSLAGARTYAYNAKKNSERK
ncbi:MAG: hypothetical protein CTY12_00585 [Methylotenera sp.]|nr:MAG: hypothetical protein CTY12_00585 [Methylotenera sp.]